MITEITEYAATFGADPSLRVKHLDSFTGSLTRFSAIFSSYAYHSFRDVLIADATIVSLYQDAADIYTATGDDQAELELHLTESLSTGLPTRFRTTDGTTHKRSQLPTGSG